MKTCITCGKRITPVEQCGDVNHPLCISCWLAGYAWVYDDKEVMNELLHGASLEDAQKTSVQKEITELQKFSEEFWSMIEN